VPQENTFKEIGIINTNTAKNIFKVLCFSDLGAEYYKNNTKCTHSAQLARAFNLSVNLHHSGG